MQEKFYIPNLVVNELGNGVVNQILDKTFKPIVENKTLYVSNNGDDSTADGSVEKPFKTLWACIVYAYKNLVSNFQIRIMFLTDYTETNVKSIKLRTHISSSYFEINGVGHNVSLPSFRLYQGCFTIRNVTITNNTESTYPIYATEQATVFIGNLKINIDPSITTGKVIYANRAAFIACLQNTSINVKTHTNYTGDYFTANNAGRLTLTDLNNITISDEGIKGTLYASRLCSLVTVAPRTFNCPKNREEAKAYYCHEKSHISFFGRGSDLAIGGIKDIDETSTIS